MKKKTFSLTSLFALLFGLSFGLASCSDNDLDASGGKGTDGIETAEQAEKHDALLRLLSAVADADSLPDNWNADGFTMEPTIGVAESEGNKFVRLVSTRNAEEADREFRCMIGDAITGKATDSEWTKEGIGTLKFKVQNQSDLYATIDVDVKQLPHLTQIRFVPASALGNNSWYSKVKSAYYQFGDIVSQKVDGEDIYWVCVRPCSVEGNLGKSHWCTFDLQPVGEKDANYKKINDGLVLPTNLCSKESSGQKMVQNFFNVLRVIANPTTYKGASGIDDITTKEFSYDEAHNISNFWKIKELWNGVYEPELADVVGKDKCEVGAYYYGYNTVFLGNGNYRMYRLDMKNKEDGKLIDVATPTNPWVYKNTAADFSKRSNSGNDKSEGEDDVNDDNQVNDKKEAEKKSAPTTLVVNLPSDKEVVAPQYQYIVKYRTGAELEGTWGYNDNDPTQAFTKNGLKDVFVSKKLFNDERFNYEKIHSAFFSFGDEVSLTNNFDGLQFCVKEAKDDNILKSDEENNKTFFVCSSKGKIDEGGIDEDVEISDEMAGVILYHLMNCYLANAGVEVLPYTIGSKIYNKYVKNLVNTLGYRAYTPNGVTFNYNDFLPNFDVEDKAIKDANNIITVRANINSCFYELVYNPNNAQNKCVVTVSKELDPSLYEIRVHAYKEIHAFKENYSLKNNLVVGMERTVLQNTVKLYIESFLKDCTFKK